MKFIQGSYILLAITLVLPVGRAPITQEAVDNNNSEVWRSSKEICKKYPEGSIVDMVHADFSEERLPSQSVIRRAPNLKTLVLGGPYLTDDFLREVEKLGNLTTLVLDSTDISEQGVDALKKKLPNLRVLRSQKWAINQIKRYSPELRWTSVINKSHPNLLKLLGDKHFEKLTMLTIQWDEERGPQFPISNEALMPLKYCTAITHLDISYTRINDAGIEYLKRIRSLESVRLPIAEVSNDSLAELAEHSNLQRLTVSFPTYSGFPDQARKRLREIRLRIPKCSVVCHALDE